MSLRCLGGLRKRLRVSGHSGELQQNAYLAQEQTAALINEYPCSTGDGVGEASASPTIVKRLARLISASSGCGLRNWLVWQRLARRMMRRAVLRCFTAVRQRWADGHREAAND